MAPALGVAAITLPLLARRRLPFGAPAGVWLLGAALSFVDGHLVPDAFGLTVAGMVAAFCWATCAPERRPAPGWRS